MICLSGRYHTLSRNCSSDRLVVGSLALRNVASILWFVCLNNLCAVFSISIRSLK